MPSQWRPAFNRIQEQAGIIGSVWRKERGSLRTAMVIPLLLVADTASMESDSSGLDWGVIQIRAC